MSWRASPAKLNLFLHVNGRREDGYHELQTLFVLLNAGDRVRVRRRADDRIARVADLPGVSEDADLGVRAARLLREAARREGHRQPLGAEIEVRKAIPMGGGLGGGSSNAATVLLALDEIWELGLGSARLAELGARLGADVPVFVAARSAWAEGIGERLQPVLLDDVHYVVVVPPVHVPTAAVFGDPALTRNSPKLKISDFIRAAPSGHGSASATPDQAGQVPMIDVPRLWAATRNDCERVVRRAYPPVDDALVALDRHAPARLTGTGAAVFARFGTAQAAAAAADALVGEGRVAWIARAMEHAAPAPGTGARGQGAEQGAASWP